MARQDKYSIRDLKRDFPNDEACVELLFDARHTRECSCGGTYKPLQGRRQYQCSKCRFQIAPTAGTIFHKSPTPMTLWFHAIWVFSNAKSGISAKEMERQLGVTYKCAWRILMLIRKALRQNTKRLKGDVEIDGGIFGGRKRAGADNKYLSKVMKGKTRVVAAVARKGRIKASVTQDLKAQTIGGFLSENVDKEGTRLMTDKSKIYNNVAMGFDRHSVDHHIKEFVRGDIHINTIEAFFSHVKRSLKGTHKVVSKKYFQSYLDGFVFLRDNRHNDSERFSALLGILLSA